MLIPTPIFDVHRWGQDRLGALIGEPIDKARITKIITNANSQTPPRGIPHRLLCRWQTVLEELDWLGLGLGKNDFSGRTDYISHVEELLVRERFLAADQQVFLIFAAPIPDAVRDRILECVFRQDVEVGIGTLLAKFVQHGRDFEFFWKFQLHAGDAEIPS